MSQNGKLAYWIMGALLTIILLLASGAAAAFNERLIDVEQTQRHRGDRMISVESQLYNLCQQICRLDSKIDDVKEELSDQRVFRHPCLCYKTEAGN